MNIIILLIPFLFVGICVLLATYSAFYMYRFMKSYSGKFKKPVQYLFFGVALFALLVIEFGVLIGLQTSLVFTLTIAITGIIAFLILLKASHSIYKIEHELLIETLKEKNRFLKKKAKLIQEKFLRRKITEDMFRRLLTDLEEEIVDTDARIMVLKEKK